MKKLMILRERVEITVSNHSLVIINKMYYDNKKKILYKSKFLCYQSVG